MAYTDVISEVASARWQVLLYQQNVWLNMGLVADLSGELQYGAKIRLPTSTFDQEGAGEKLTQAKIQGSTLASHAYPDPHLSDVSDVELVIDSGKRFNTLVPFTIQDQIRPDLLNDKVMQEVIAVRNQFNDEIRGELNSDTTAKLTEGMTTIALDVSDGDWAKADHLAAIVKNFADAAQEFDYEHQPSAGRYCVVSPAYYRLMIDQLLQNNYFVQQGENDRMFVENDVLKYRGFVIIPDDSMPPGNDAGDGDNHNMYFGVRGTGISVARQTVRMRVVESQQHAGYLLQGTETWGVKVNQPFKLRVGKTTIVA